MHILLVDDHPLFSDGVASLLKELDEKITVLKASSCNQALEISRHQPDLDLIILDLSLPDINGLDGLIKFREVSPTTPVVILSASDGNHLIRSALKRGAQGFLSKSAKPDIILNALRLVLSGDVYIPSSYSLTSNETASADELCVNLTQRQKEVLKYLVQGKANKEIAAIFKLSENTVRAHVAAIYKVLKVNNRTEAAFVMKNSIFKFEQHN